MCHAQMKDAPVLWKAKNTRCGELKVMVSQGHGRMAHNVERNLHFRKSRVGAMEADREKKCGK